MIGFDWLALRVSSFLDHSKVFDNVVEEVLEFDATVAADDEVEDLGGVLGWCGVDDLEAGGGAEGEVLGEEVFLADGVDE